MLKEGLRRMPPELLGATLQWISGLRNNTVDLREPQVRASMSSLWLYVLILYALISLLGLPLNLKCLLRLLHSTDNTDRLVLTLCCCCLLMDSVVLIPTTVVLLSHSWLLGRTLCSLLPVLQDISLQMIILLHLLLIIDRYQLVKGNVRLSVVITSLGVALLTVGFVLPYQPHITYVDLQNYLGMQFEGVAMCVSYLPPHLRIYSTFLVVITFIIPALVMATLYWRMRLMTRVRGVDVGVMYQGNDITYRIQSRQDGRSWASLRSEVRTQQCLCHMASSSVMCMLPLMLIRMYKIGDPTTGSMDLIYCASVWFAFLPTLISPLIYLRYLNNRENPSVERGEPCNPQFMDKT